MELVAGCCGAAATGSAGTTIGAGTESAAAGGVTAAAGLDDDDGASIAGDVVAGVSDRVAGDAADSDLAPFRGGAVFALATGAGDLVAAAFAGADGRAGAAVSAVGSERVSTRASDGCAPTGELMAGNVAGVDGAVGAGAMSARGAVTGVVAGAALPPSEPDGPKNTYASTARTATTSALAMTSAVVDGPLDVSSGTKPRTR